MLLAMSSSQFAPLSQMNNRSEAGCDAGLQRELWLGLISPVLPSLVNHEPKVKKGLPLLERNTYYGIPMTKGWLQNGYLLESWNHKYYTVNVQWTDS